MCPLLGQKTLFWPFFEVSTFITKTTGKKHPQKWCIWSPAHSIFILSTKKMVQNTKFSWLCSHFYRKCNFYRKQAKIWIKIKVGTIIRKMNVPTSRIGVNWFLRNWWGFWKYAAKFLSTKTFCRDVLSLEILTLHMHGVRQCCELFWRVH